MPEKLKCLMTEQIRQYASLASFQGAVYRAKELYECFRGQYLRNGCGQQICSNHGIL